MIPKRILISILLLASVLIIFSAAPLLAWPVPDTGQTQCYDDTGNVIPCPAPGERFYGQDGCYSINPPSYTKLDANGAALPDSASQWVMVRDNVTGLIWEVKRNKDGNPNYDDPRDADNTYTWYDPDDPYPGTPGDGTDTKDFINDLNNDRFGGYSDWRMPTLKELASIVDLGNPYPGLCINTAYFPHTAPFYWSSTTYAYDTDGAWVVDFYNGPSTYSFKSGGGYVRAVRGGESPSAFIDNGNGTVTDLFTGLTWQQATAPGIYTWEQALAYCEGLTLGGRSDWRLPTRKELRSIVNYTRYNPAISPDFFPGTVSSWYWSSTTSASNSIRAWFVYFYWGTDSISQKDGYQYVRAVRGGQSGSLGDSVILTLSVSDTLTGNPIPNANVVIGIRTGQTNSLGQVTFSGLALGQYNLQISAAGYTTHTETLSLNQGGAITKQVGMIKPAIISPNTNPIVTDVISYVSSRNKEAIFLNGVSYEVNFGAAVDWNGNSPGYVRFITPTGTYDEADANRIFNMGSNFGPGGRLKAVAVSANGKTSSEFDANIEVAPKPPLGGLFLMPVMSNNDFSYQAKVTTGFIEDAGVPVPDEVPMFGGESFSFDAAGDAMMDVKSDGTATYTITGNEDARGLSIAGIPFDNFAVGGNIVSRYDRRINEWRLDGGHFIMGIESKINIGPTYTLLPLVPIPAYLRGELEGNLSTEAGVVGFSDISGWQLECIAEPEIGGKIVAGVGVSSLAALEAALGNKDAIKMVLPHDPVVVEGYIMLYGTIRVVALIWQQEWPLWEYKWTWPENKASADTLAHNPASILKDIRSADWVPLPRNYSSGLVSDKLSVQSSAVVKLEAAATGTEQTLPGQTDIYPYSTPAMTRVGDDLLVTWITDDPARTANNRTCVVSARYIGGVWSAPVKFADNGTADAYPAMAEMTGGAVAAWQDANTLFADDAEFLDLLAGQEIAVAMFDSAIGTWGPAARLTNNAYSDRSPTLAASGDQALTVWIANEDNQMLGTPDMPDRLEFSYYNGSAWQPAGVIAADQGAVVRLGAVMNADDSVTLVYVRDEDGDLSTDTDTELYASQFAGSVWTAPVRLTNDVIPDTSPHLSHDSLGNQILVWFKGGNFMMAQNLNVANAQTIVAHMPSSGAADFQLVTSVNGQLQIVWPDASSKGQDMFMATYDPILNLWGKGIQITDTDRMERSPAAAMTVDGHVAVVYNSVAMGSEIRQVDVNGTSVDITVPVPGATDLRMALVQLDGDLAVQPGSVGFSQERFDQGDTVALTATIQNTGLTAQSQIPVAFYYGDPANGGTEIGTRPVVEGPLAPGDNATVTASWKIPNPADVSRKVYVVADPGLTLDDRDRGNNSASVVAFQPDMAVYRLFSDQLGPVRRTITVGISNTGNMAATIIPLVIRQGSETGTVVFEQTIAALGPGEARDVVFDWDATGAAATDGYVTFYASANPSRGINESSFLNNEQSLQVPGAFPQAAAVPSIPEGATDVLLQPLLDWENCNGATRYAVYVWKSGETRPAQPAGADLTDSFYQMTSALDSGTVYLWQVVAINDSGETESAIWSFTTLDSVPKAFIPAINLLLLGS